MHDSCGKYVVICQIPRNHEISDLCVGRQLLQTATYLVGNQKLDTSCKTTMSQGFYSFHPAPPNHVGVNTFILFKNLITVKLGNKELFGHPKIVP